MIRIHLPAPIVLGALLAAAPAFAANPPGASTSADTTKPLCSSLKNPNAGKLADKSMGEATEQSASPVHLDCIPDSASGPSATANPSPPASATYGGLRDTTSNAESSMPSTASQEIPTPKVSGNRSTQ